MLLWPWTKLERRAICAERCTYGSGRRSAKALLTPFPMKRGDVYLAAVVDWNTRRVLSWRLSITLETAFCIEAVDEAMAKHGKPDIFNTDQGSQFTSLAFIKLLTDADIKISMDGKGAWRDNVFVERLWRSIKYEEVYLKAYENVPEARTEIGRYITFYNTKRPHSSLDGKTPDQAYFNALTPICAFGGIRPPLICLRYCCGEAILNVVILRSF